MEQITIKDIAKMCGVGVSTVSRAMNNHPDINQETRDKIMSIIKEHNYVPNNSARNLKRSDAKAIAVLVKGISNPFFAPMIKVMEEEIQKKKYSLVLYHVESYEDEVDVAFELVKEKRLRGIVFLGGYFSHTEEKLRQLEVPFILSTIGESPECISKKNYSSVSVDDIAESYKAVEYLCQLGHKRIATITAPSLDQSIGKLRLEGYKKALRENHIPIEEDLICTMKEEIEDYSMENGYEVTRELLAKGTEFTAIFAIADSLAIGACKAILDSGKRIPEDYSVIGFDGIEMTRYYSPTITTIAQPVKEMAYETIHILFDVIKGETKHQHRVFPGELIVGSSTCEVNKDMKY